MNWSDRLVGGAMTANALFATYNAFIEPSLLTVAAAYFSWSPALVSNGLVDGWWLRIHTKGSVVLFMREMLLWPITIVEFLLFKHRFTKASKLIEAAGTDAEGSKTLKREDYEYVLMVRTKYIDFLSTSPKMKGE